MLTIRYVPEGILTTC